MARNIFLFIFEKGGDKELTNPSAKIEWGGAGDVYWDYIAWDLESFWANLGKCQNSGVHICLRLFETHIRFGTTGNPSRIWDSLELFHR